MMNSRIRLRRIFVAGSLMSVSVLPLSAADLRVMQDESGAFTSIQAAIQAGSDGDIVQVGPGIYREDLDFMGKDLVVSSLDGASSTVIEGSGATSVVTIASGEPQTARLSGFTLRGGGGEPNLYGDTVGGGIRVEGASARLEHLILEDNRADYGAGVAVIDGEASLEDCRLQSGSARFGGGLYARDSLVEGHALTLLENDAEIGGGIRSYDGALILTNSLVGANVSTGAGAGGVDLRYTDNRTRLTNNLLLENSGAAAGGLQLYSAEAEVVNNIIAFNAGGAGVHVYAPPSTPQLRYNDVYDNAGGLYSGAISDLTGQQGNVSGNPDFIVYTQNGSFDGDFLGLLPSSPAFNGGDPDVQDPDGSRSDMGIYGGPGSLPVSYEDIDNDGMVDAWESLHGLDSSLDDGSLDLDGDGLSNLSEYEQGTLPEEADSDGDGWGDGEEVAAGQDPLDASDQVPVASAGPDQAAVPGSIVVLTAMDSTDPNGDALSYSWVVTSAPAGSILSGQVLGNAMSVAFTPDEVGTFIIRLTVSDGRAFSQDEVRVRGLGTIRVPEDAATIQDGIRAAQDGESVLVAPGTYAECLDFMGKAIQVRGEGGAAATLLNSSGCTHGVLFASGETQESVLEDITVTGATPQMDGTGIWIYLSHPTLRRVIVRDNLGYDGGGIAVSYGGVSIFDSLLQGNRASYLGGAIKADYAELEIVRTELRSNVAQYDGGAIWADSTLIQLSNSIIRENEHGDSDSAAIEVWDSTEVTLYNNLFLRNRGNGVADLYLNNGTADVRNTIFGGASEPFAIHNDGATLTVAYNDIVGYQTAGIDTYSGETIEEANLAVPPQFVSFSDDGVPENDDFALLGSSRCIDAGDPAARFADLDTTRNDMGIYGGPLADQSQDSDQDGMPDGWELLFGLDPSVDDSQGDLDDDGLTNLAEYQAGTSPVSADSDLDGVSDGVELSQGLDPLDASDQRPVASAGEDVSAALGQTAVLSGQASQDPNGDALTYSWHIAALAAGSTLEDSDIQAQADGTARFTPDVRGIYELSLVVSDGRVSSAPDFVTVYCVGVLEVPGDFPTIQSALDDALPGETVRVAAGTYLERIVIEQPVVLEGAGAGLTLLDGQSQGTVVSVHIAEGAEAVFRGLTLRSGSGTLYNSTVQGGGLLVQLGRAVVEDCQITGNQAESGAGVAVVAGASAELVDVQVDRNSALQAGGGIYSQGDVTLIRTAVRSNHALRGGGVRAEAGQVLAISSIFQSNEAYQGTSGGGLDLDATVTDLQNCVLAGNVGGRAAEIVAEGGHLRLNSAILAGNGGTALYGGGNLGAEITYTDVYGYRTRYAGTLFEQTGMNGNISAQPRFVSWTMDHNEANDDFHLRVGSPCRNTGDPSADLLDVNGSRNDMGMYGGPESE